jgi:hypothetical protein
MTTKEERYRRIAILERAISERGWSLQIKRAMASEFNVTVRTIDRYREDLIGEYRRELEGESYERRRAEFLGRLRGHQRAALASGRLGPLASMMSLESKVVGLDISPSEESVGSVQVVLRVPGVKG